MRHWEKMASFRLPGSLGKIWGACSNSPVWACLTKNDIKRRGEKGGGGEREKIKNGSSSDSQSRSCPNPSLFFGFLLLQFKETHLLISFLPPPSDRQDLIPFDPTHHLSALKANPSKAIHIHPLHAPHCVNSIKTPSFFNPQLDSLLTLFISISMQEPR